MCFKEMCFYIHQYNQKHNDKGCIVLKKRHNRKQKLTEKGGNDMNDMKT